VHHRNFRLKAHTCERIEELVLAGEGVLNALDKDSSDSSENRDIDEEDDERGTGIVVEDELVFRGLLENESFR